MRKTPTISVLMSTYNTPEDWLSEAIESILSQTFSDFEFIIADDCSTQSLDNIRTKYSDERIIWFRNERNLGLTKTLNKALKLAKGKYIARMDADDISLPERFSTQIRYMESHPEVIVCGSYRRAFGNENKDEIWNIPLTREEQQVQLFFFNCGLTHPTAMFRKSMLDEYGITYNEDYIKAQDYGIWVQCTRYAPMAVIPEVLLKYRKSDRQISSAGRKNQLENDKKIKLDQVVALGIEPTDEEKNIHIAFLNNNYYFNSKKIEQWINKLIEVNRETRYFSNTNFTKAIYRRWYRYCYKQFKQEGKQDYKSEYYHSKKISYCIPEMLERMKIKIALKIDKEKRDKK